MELITIKEKAHKQLELFTTSDKIKILERNPVSGGIPPIEKKIITKENAHNLFALNKFVKLDKNNVLDSLLKKLFVLY